jgi:PadR family transcriptional regulator PadR
MSVWLYKQMEIGWIFVFVFVGVALLQYHGLILTVSRRGVFFLSSLGRKTSMADKPADLLQGTLDMLILKPLALEPMHGYGIAVRLEQMSKAFSGSMQVRAKYYVPADQGRNRLNSETREWGRQAAAIARILEAS